MEEWILVSSLDGGSEHFSKSGVLGLSEYIKQRKKGSNKGSDAGKESRSVYVIIAGGAIIALPEYITKGGIDRFQDLAKDINTFNDLVVATKPHFVRIVESADKVYYILGPEDKLNIRHIYSNLLDAYSKEVPTQILLHYINLERSISTLSKIVEATKASYKNLHLSLSKIDEEISKTKNEKMLESLKSRREKVMKEIENAKKKIYSNQTEIDDLKKINSKIYEVLLFSIQNKPNFKEVLDNLLKDVEKMFPYSAEEIEKLKQEFKNVKEAKRNGGTNAERIEREYNELLSKLKTASTNLELQNKAKSLANKIRKYIYQSKELERGATTGFEKATGNIRGTPEIGSKLMEIATLEYITYIKNIFGRRMNFLLITFDGDNGKEETYEHSISIGSYKVRISTNYNFSEKYTFNPRILIPKGDENFKIFPWSGAYITTQATSDGGYSFALGVPPFVDEKKVMEEMAGRIKTKYSKVLEKGIFASGAISIRFEGPHTPEFVFLKPQFFDELARERVEREKEVLEKIALEVGGKSAGNLQQNSNGRNGLDKIDLIQIKNKLPSEIHPSKLREAYDLVKENLYSFANTEMRGAETQKIDFYIVADAHIGSSPTYLVTNPTPQALLGRAAEKIKGDLSNSKLPVLVVLGDMIEGFNYDLSETQIFENFSKFSRWVEKNYPDNAEELKREYSYYLVSNFPKINIGIKEATMPLYPVAEEVAMKDGKIIIVSGNHRIQAPGGRKVDEAALIEEDLSSYLSDKGVLIPRFSGEPFGAGKIKIRGDQGEGGEENEFVINVLHKAPKLRTDERTLCAHFHNLEAYIFSSGWKVQVPPLVSPNSYPLQIQEPVSDELRGFLKFSIVLSDEAETEIHLKPFFVKDLIAEEESQSYKIIKEFEDELTNISLDRKHAIQNIESKVDSKIAKLSGASEAAKPSESNEPSKANERGGGAAGKAEKQESSDSKNTKPQKPEKRTLF